MLQIARHALALRVNSQGIQAQYQADHQIFRHFLMLTVNATVVCSFTAA